MTLEQANKIWQLANNIHKLAVVYMWVKKGENRSEYIKELIQVKSELYKYLKENLDDTENL